MSAVAATAPGGAEVRHRGAITVSIMLATIMQALDTTIANVALPHMQGSLGAAQDQVSWVLTSYIVAAAIATPLTGWLTGRLGRKRLFMVSVTGFTIASMLCGLAQSLEQMVVYRLLQGLFGAALVPLSQAVLLDINPRENHCKAMAIWGAGIMVGPILGPSLGGWLTDNFDWRWVFYINLPVGILALGGIAAFVAETPRKLDQYFDMLGFTLLAVAIGAFQMMLDRGQHKDWFGSPEIVIEAALAGGAFYM
ncbi:MAG: DHA2 family efflux MFS transporter permease subunit, partial [Ferrovibrionaceae bacterium]